MVRKDNKDNRSQHERQSWMHKSLYSVFVGAILKDSFKDNGVSLWMLWIIKLYRCLLEKLSGRCRLTLGLIKEGTCPFNIEQERKNRDVNCCEAFGNDDLQLTWRRTEKDDKIRVVGKKTPFTAACWININMASLHFPRAEGTVLWCLDVSDDDIVKRLSVLVRNFLEILCRENKQQSSAMQIQRKV